MDGISSVVEINHLSYRYENDYALENIHFSLPKGAYLTILGPNGSGKSTLLKLLLGLLKKQTGEIRLFGTPFEQFKDWEKIGFVSQKANSFNTGFPATVYEVVASGLVKKVGFFRRLKKEHVETIYRSLEIVGMTKYIRKNIGELSGGQQQRVFIARALVSNPELLILDEPTVGVDIENVKIFYELLEKLNQEGITLILVTHDMEVLKEKVSHVAYLNQRLHFFGEREKFHEEFRQLFHTLPFGGGGQ